MGDAYVKWYRTQAYYDGGGWRATWAGEGGGAWYVTNGRRDYAVVLTPLGAVRVHLWTGSNWSS